jgi:hypothetical protein
MSNQTPIRTVRVPTKLWTKAKAKAKKDNTTVSEVIVKALEAYAQK